MVKMQIPGILIEVNEADVTMYKRAGYTVVEEKPAPVVKEDKAEKKTNDK
jgi:hypothetical protein